MGEPTRELVENRRHLDGLIYAFAAFTTWGVLPAYWKWLGEVPALEILAHRIIWSFLFVAILFLFSGGVQGLRSLGAGLRRPAVWLSSILISCNWLTYIWAVNHNHVVEASLGYYINPLFSIALGTIFLREKLTRMQWSAIAVAAAGVLVVTLHHGQVPWIALSLAATFTWYGWTKKRTTLDAKTGLALETIVVAPIALAYLTFVHSSGGGMFGNPAAPETWLLIGAGVVTALPLLWFAKASQRTTLVTLGFVQYIGPSISLLLGVLVYGESFTADHWLSFGLIWIGLAIYTLSHSIGRRRSMTKPAIDKPYRSA
jgi:chloramphenicol-sensitive protein RarD